MKFTEHTENNKFNFIENIENNNYYSLKIKKKFWNLQKMKKLFYQIYRKYR